MFPFLVRDKADINNDALTFHPAMAHQIFGETETIFGYQDLHVRVMYTAGPLHIYLGVDYGKRVNEISGGEIKADDVVSTIAQSLPDGCYFINLDEFLKTLDKADKFQPFGEKISEYRRVSDDGSERLSVVKYRRKSPVTGKNCTELHGDLMGGFI